MPSLAKYLANISGKVKEVYAIVTSSGVSQAYNIVQTASTGQLDVSLIPSSVGNKERRHDWVTPYDYCGTAVLGSLETAAVWTITRITVFSSGNISTSTLTNVKWSDHLTLSY